MCQVLHVSLISNLPPLSYLERKVCGASRPSRASTEISMVRQDRSLNRAQNATDHLLYSCTYVLPFRFGYIQTLEYSSASAFRPAGFLYGGTAAWRRTFTITITHTLLSHTIHFHTIMASAPVCRCTFDSAQLARLSSLHGEDICQQ